ncbi:MAG TPA: Clp protease N-terminal domain-containing protein [Umezawaea sp.]|nr:Clp protease N-terminal domain-containing protein [Umezawaea sp.]
MDHEFDADEGKARIADLAAARARALARDRVGTEHLLAVLLGTGYGKVLFTQLGIAPLPLLAGLAHPTADPADGPGFTASALEALRYRPLEPGGHRAVDTLACLLHGLLEGEGAVAEVLAEHDVTSDRVRDALVGVEDWTAGPWGGQGPDGEEPAADVLDSPLVGDDLRAEVLELRRRKEIAIDALDFDTAAALRGTEKELLRDVVRRGSP